MATNNSARSTYFLASLLLVLLPLLIQNVDGQLRGRSLSSQEAKNGFFPENVKVDRISPSQKGCVLNYASDSYVMMEDGCTGMYCSPDGEPMEINIVDCKRKREAKNMFMTKKKHFN